MLAITLSCKNDNTSVITHPNTATLVERIPAPKGFDWMQEKEGSFGKFLQNVKLKEAGSKILNYKKEPINNQSEHVAIIDYDIGEKDLQQCADAVIRLRSEYLFERKKYDQISFHFTNGDVFTWNDYKKGIRPRLINSNTVAFKKTAQFDDSYASFRNYLDIVYTYAGTISIQYDSKAVTDNENIQAGDFLLTPGSPGHAVIIVGRAINKEGEKIFLLAEGYTPAQSIHVITNPTDGDINPWYRLDIDSDPTITARYAFTKTNIRSFK